MDVSTVISSRDANSWADFLSHADVPVLKHTAREIQRLREDEDKTSLRDIHIAVVQDPMMAFRVLRFAQQNRHKSQVQDLVLIESAIMMMGMTTFFNRLPPEPLVETILKSNLAALTRLLKLIHRSHRAAKHALDWSALLYDLRGEEIMVAALLHDLSEMLMWCFAPEKMLKIAELQTADKTLRSKVAQEQVLGFSLHELQLKLVESCGLPGLLTMLMHEEKANDKRIKNVMVAVNFARHAANGWDDAALPDDYKAIADLLHVDVTRAKHLVGAPQ